jgi:hypothetical protein
MTKEIAQILITFMNRVQLQGAEVNAWTAAMNVLTPIANPLTEETTNG